MLIEFKTFKKKVRDSKLAADILFVIYLLQRFSGEEELGCFLKGDLNAAKSALFSSGSLNREGGLDRSTIEGFLSSVSSASQKSWFKTLLNQVETNLYRPYGVESLLVGKDLKSMLEQCKSADVCGYTNAKRFIEAVTDRITRQACGAYTIKGGILAALEYANKGPSSKMTLFFSTDASPLLPSVGIVGTITLPTADAEKIAKLQCQGKAFRNLKHSWYYYPANRFRRVSWERWQAEGAPEIGEVLLRFASHRYMTWQQLADFAAGAFPFSLQLFAPLEGAEGALSLVAATTLSLDKGLVPGSVVDLEIYGRTFHLMADPCSAFSPRIINPGSHFAIFGAPITAPNYLFLIYVAPNSCKSFKPIQTISWLGNSPQLGELFEIR